ncbi:hypothetical protein INR49_023719 [Caranx melampygus]|nr:hypothetical protein INR49_023719 [Caranx melampygus]
MVVYLRKSLHSLLSVFKKKGSTFKPLNPVKRLDKSKKRSRRTTIMGIPNQVQKELVCGIGSPISKSEYVVTGQGYESSESASVTAGEDAKNKRNFIRSLSVMKTKQPPAPPRRTNSLHSNKIRSNTGVLVESKDLNDTVSGEVETGTENPAAKDEIKLVTGDTDKTPTPVSNSAASGSPDVSSSPLSPTQTSSKEMKGPPEPQSGSSSSSPQKTPSEGGKFERTMSPSSGYSSQSGTPTLSPKGISPTSPEKQKKKPIKPERSVSRASSSAASPSSSLTSLSSGTSEPANLPPQGTSPTVTQNELTPNNVSTLQEEIKELLNIPPPPKVKAPCPPPPETWVHNRRTFELLCGPCPNVSKETHKPEQVEDSTDKQAETQTKAREEVQMSPKSVRSHHHLPLPGIPPYTSSLKKDTPFISIYAIR